MSFIYVVKYVSIIVILNIMLLNELNICNELYVNIFVLFLKFFGVVDVLMYVSVK